MRRSYTYRPRWQARDWPWLDIGGIQVTNNSGDNRWHTNPGLHIASDWYGAPGRMYLSIDWGSQSGQNPDVITSIPLPVGEWFDLEFSWQWTSAFDSTMEVWINGTLAATLDSVRTHRTGQSKVELYGNLYGSPNGGKWAPNPMTMYRRNIRASKLRITSPP